MTTLTTKTTAVEERILNEGYGSGAWHGPDLKAALANVTAEVAFTRPGPERHNIAEIALHHAYCARGVRAKLTGSDPAPFILEGDDWFSLPESSRLSWAQILEVVHAEQQRLGSVVADIGAGRVQSPVPDSERFDLVLGITCHAVYHAGQIQLIKRLATG